MPGGVVITSEAAVLLRHLQAKHGPLLFHQSGGCCDGSVPLCLKRDDFQVGSRDVLFGTVEDTPFYLGAAQYELLRDTQLILDVVEGENDSFSLEAGEGLRFITRNVPCEYRTDHKD